MSKNVFIMVSGERLSPWASCYWYVSNQ